MKIIGENFNKIYFGDSFISIKIIFDVSFIKKYPLREYFSNGLYQILKYNMVAKYMNMKTQDIEKTETWKKYSKKKNITQTTLNTYLFSLLQFCKANNKNLDSMVHEILEMQMPYIDDEGRIHEYNPEYSLLDDYLNQTVTYLKSKGNSNHSTYSHLVRIRAVLASLNIKLPAKVEMEKDVKDW